MNTFPSKTIVNAVRAEYPIGCTIVLLSMNDPYREMPSGMKGIVTAVDDTGTVFANWENGSTLGAVYGVDRIKRVFKNTRVNYLYRDACNYKTQNTVVVPGIISKEQIEKIINCCIDKEMFIPEQIGWDLLRGWDVTEDDHPYAELDKDSFEYTDDGPTCDMSVEELIAAFQKAKNNWDDEKYAPEAYFDP